MTTTQYADTQDVTTGSELQQTAFTNILNEDKVRELKVLEEAPPPSCPLPYYIAATKEQLAKRIERHPRLTFAQKEQALYFLFSSAYQKDGRYVTYQYVRLCLNPKYTARGTAWTGSTGKRKFDTF